MTCSYTRRYKSSSQLAYIQQRHTVAAYAGERWNSFGQWGVRACVWTTRCGSDHTVPLCPDARWSTARGPMWVARPRAARLTAAQHCTPLPPRGPLPSHPNAQSGETDRTTRGQRLHTATAPRASSPCSSCQQSDVRQHPGNHSNAGPIHTRPIRNSCSLQSSCGDCVWREGSWARGRGGEVGGSVLEELLWEGAARATPQRSQLSTFGQG